MLIESTYAFTCFSANDTSMSATPTSASPATPSMDTSSTDTSSTETQVPSSYSTLPSTSDIPSFPSVLPTSTDISSSLAPTSVAMVSHGWVRRSHCIHTMHVCPLWKGDYHFHCKNKLVVLTTEWLPCLQTKYRK